MSSVARSRSLRKPSATSAELSSTTKDTERHGSPSRLPVKPHTRSTSTTTASTSGTGLKASRLPSGSLGRSASTKQAADPTKKQTSRYPPSAGTTRATSTARPTSSGASTAGTTTQTRRVPTHMRAKSTTTATTLNPTTTLRPPSQGASSGTTTRTAHTRNASVDRPARTGPAAAPTRTQQPNLRPAFSTLQQHYSPAKSRDPKPLTSAILAPPSPSKLPANVASSAETSRLQAELLQLHLLHRHAAAVEAQWRASAKEKFGERFARLADVGEEVTEREREGLERENVLALRSWDEGGRLEEKIQGLDGVVNGVWTLSEPGGRYARMVRRFERWMDQVYEIEERRRNGTYLLQGGQGLFVGELEATWKDDCDGIIRKLDGWWRQLRDIGAPPESEDGEKSSLERILDGSRSLIDDMLAELNLMEEIGQEALAREDAWIEMINRDDDDDDTPRAGAIWRVV